jgi:hypothetical protein
MKLSERLSQPLTVRSLGGSVVCGRRPNSSALPSAPLGVSPAPRRPCNHSDARLASEVRSAWADVDLRISIVARAELVVPSN